MKPSPREDSRAAPLEIDRRGRAVLDAVHSAVLACDLEGRLFYANEAALLDERRLDEWLALWHPEGRYWAPTRRSCEGRPDAAAPGHRAACSDARYPSIAPSRCSSAAMRARTSSVSSPSTRRSLGHGNPVSQPRRPARCS